MWIRLLLVGSLAVNLLGVGLFAGAAWRHAGHGARPPGPASYGEPYVRAMPRKDRREMFRAMRAAGGAALPDRAARRAMYAQVVTALRAQPFEAETLREVIDRQGAATRAVQAAAQAAWLDHVGRMAPAARAAYADAIEEVLSRGPRERRSQND